MYVTVDFIYMGLLDLWGARAGNNKIKNSLPIVGFEPGTFRLRCERAKRLTTRADIYRALDRVLSEFAI